MKPNPEIPRYRLLPEKPRRFWPWRGLAMLAFLLAILGVFWCAGRAGAEELRLCGTIRLADGAEHPFEAGGEATITLPAAGAVTIKACSAPALAPQPACAPLSPYACPALSPVPPEVLRAVASLPRLKGADLKRATDEILAWFVMVKGVEVAAP